MPGRSTRTRNCSRQRRLMSARFSHRVRPSWPSASPSLRLPGGEWIWTEGEQPPGTAKETRGYLLCDQPRGDTIAIDEPPPWGKAAAWGNVVSIGERTCCLKGSGEGGTLSCGRDLGEGRCGHRIRSVPAGWGWRTLGGRVRRAAWHRSATRLGVACRGREYVKQRACQSRRAMPMSKLLTAASPVSNVCYEMFSKESPWRESRGTVVGATRLCNSCPVA